MSKVWFITGATRGLGAEIARTALAAGHTVVATGREPQAVVRALGESERLLAVRLDVTGSGQPEAAVKAAVERFGRIDVLVNNAGYSLIGALEELSTEELSRLFATNVLGLAAVTRAVLPTMRAQRSGHILNMSSSAGIAGFMGGSAYCASKFAVEGLSESLAQEVAPLGIKVTVLEPGTFRTGFLSEDSTVFARQVIADYDPTAGGVRQGVRAMDGRQAGDPRKLAQALLTLVAAGHPPLRFNAGADSVAMMEQTLTARREELGRWRGLSESLAHTP
ncbi:oxidoreductase [Melittangium boletus]|uniref:oxidoreductase n=1 Tax=Melittangium boletus TaxID=83453 RepID=UPI003DA5311D